MDNTTELNEWASTKVASLLADACLVAAVVLCWLDDLESWE